MGRRDTPRAALLSKTALGALVAVSFVQVPLLAQTTNTPVSPTPQATRFVFAQTDPKGRERFFVFELLDSSRIREAREIIANPGNRKNHVQGTVIQKPAAYNPEWSFHLAPNSIGFFENQIEVCDANVTYVQDHLDEVGGSFLPKSFWCPWSSRLVREIR